MAAVLEPASPLPPEMIAPAWPMRRPGRRGDAGEKPTLGLLAAAFALIDQKRGGFSLGEPADFADHDDRGGFWIGQKHLQHVDEFGALDWIAADTDSRGLAEALLGGLEHRFIGQRARPRHDADIAALENVARHDPDLPFPPGHTAPA